MKFIHTSDWHLGQNLMDNKRREEHEKFLDWLLDYINQNEIDALVIAGDIFDSGTPPNYALELYYNFLYQLSLSECKQVIIVGGNHDSPATLNAPREILAALNITVIPEGDKLKEEVIVVEDRVDPIAIFCAVPFLHDRVVRKSIPGQSYEEKSKALMEGIKQHYQQVAELAQKRRKDLNTPDIPIIATGHLLTSHANTTDSEREIYIGNLSSSLSGSSFPDIFDYVALGHLHNSQIVEDNPNIRYAGSPIPLSFKEAGQEKKIFEIEIKDRENSVESITIPEYRKLRTVMSSLDELSERLDKIEKQENELPPWLEIIITDNESGEFVNNEVHEIAQDFDLEILAVMHENKAEYENLSQEDTEDLKHLDPETVFKRRLENEEIEDEESLLNAFKEMLNQTL